LVRSPEDRLLSWPAGRYYYFSSPFSAMETGEVIQR
jgi:hypothetical protein